MVMVSNVADGIQKLAVSPRLRINGLLFHKAKERQVVLGVGAVHFGNLTVN
jgi:hypothetical protein